MKPPGARFVSIELAIFPKPCRRRFVDAVAEREESGKRQKVH
jgi:hypothetical protein